MSEQVILTEVRDRVATLTLHRPEKLNAVNVELLEERSEEHTSELQSP